MSDLNCTSPGGHHYEENSNSYNCNYIDSYKFYLTCDRNTCIHCNEKFTTKIYLDDHTIRKHSKILECTFCTFTTTVKEFLAEHVLRHSETSTSHTRCMCIQCNATFKHKQSLDDHIIKKHPDCLATISSKIHECTYCTYKTTLKSHLNRHLLQHSEAEDSHKLFTCIHCDSSFKCNRSLGNHIINRHPDFAASVSSKIHTCPYCAYKTTSKASLTKHTLRYSEHSTCITCNSVFKIKNQLDDYTIKEDPDFISSDSSKILQCTLCTMKTNMKRSLE
ncbi:unnamed protein product [Acanthoscelides obtectus]|uniref:C2H2-type domain-containing protein n=1 Tax=Acanthoscelides obtectus TaxID=200917 RepID=A0A9P0L503_ACAOB|nr:unnamed protein product [Acanthoscelides obtectus]CAK1620180.1 hypothetical protein AOBTE_LOCUS231 [Acanthoscelides obtectus]